MPEMCEAGRFPAHTLLHARTAARGRWVLWQLDNTDLLVKLSLGKASQRGAICWLERQGSWNSRQPMLWLRIKPTARSSLFTTLCNHTRVAGSGTQPRQPAPLEPCSGSRCALGFLHYGLYHWGSLGDTFCLRQSVNSGQGDGSCQTFSPAESQELEEL